jgi:pSer/pThr/pTyr-binding forkhead associated (FHA) protein
MKVLQGPDVGSMYVLLSGKAYVGRGEENDLMLSDLRCSRRHFEMEEGPGGWGVNDLGSANGVIINGKTLRQGVLRTGDTIQIGETVLEFMASDAGTQLLVAPPREAHEIQAEQDAFEMQRKRVRQMAGIRSQGTMTGLHAREQGSSFDGLKKLFASAGKSAQPGGVASAPNPNSKRLLIYGVLGVASWFAMNTDPNSGGGNRRPSAAQQAQASKAAEEKKARDLASYLPQAETGSKASQSANLFFRDGFREFNSKNYLRARIQFETALQISPSHPLARKYLENANTAIEEMVKVHLQRGKRNMDTGRLRDARVDFETVMRTLYREQTNPSFIEAKDQLKEVTQRMREAN